MTGLALRHDLLERSQGGVAPPFSLDLSLGCHNVWNRSSSFALVTVSPPCEANAAGSSDRGVSRVTVSRVTVSRVSTEHPAVGRSVAGSRRTVIVASPQTGTYTIGEGDTLVVNGNFDRDLTVRFDGGGAVQVNNGANVGLASFLAQPDDVGTTRVRFNNGSEATGVFYQGRGGDDGLVVARGAVLGQTTLDFSNDGGRSSACGLCNMQAGSAVEDVLYLGSSGRDVFIVGGEVFGGFVSADLGAGSDLASFREQADVTGDFLADDDFPAVGSVDPKTGRGNDRVDFKGGVYDSVRIRTEGGNDKIRVLASATEEAPADFRSALRLETGSGNDRLDFFGYANLQTGGRFETGDGSDFVALRNISGGGAALVVETGTGGATRDVVDLKNMRFRESLDLQHGGNVLIRETGFNRYGLSNSPTTFEKLTISGGTASSTATIRLLGDSLVTSSYTIASESRLNLVSNLSNRGYEGFIVGSERNDFIRINGGQASNLSVETFGGDDRVLFTDGARSFGGPFVKTGSGGDIVVFQDYVSQSLAEAPVRVQFGGSPGKTNRLGMSGSVLLEQFPIDRRHVRLAAAPRCRVLAGPSRPQARATCSKDRRGEQRPDSHHRAGGERLLLARSSGRGPRSRLAAALFGRRRHARPRPSPHRVQQLRRDPPEGTVRIAGHPNRRSTRPPVLLQRSDRRWRVHPHRQQ